MVETDIRFGFENLILRLPPSAPPYTGGERISKQYNVKLILNVYDVVFEFHRQSQPNMKPIFEHHA